MSPTRWRRPSSRSPTSARAGVLARFPNLRFATVEAGIGWVPWLMDAMDEAYRKHHMWVRPKLDMLPSEYFRQQRLCHVPRRPFRPDPG